MSTVYRILGATVENTDTYGKSVPERLVVQIQVGKSPKLAECELTRTEAFRLADQLLTALWRTGEPS